MSNIEKKNKRLGDVKLSRTYKGLSDEFSKIAHIRFINGLDKRVSPPTVQKKCLKHPLWAQIREDLKVAKFLEDEKAQFSVFNIFTFIIVAILAVVLFGGLIYSNGIIYNTLHQVGLQNEVNAGQPAYSNMTAAADITFGTLNNSIQSLRMVALVYILGLAVIIMVTNALVRVHPLWFFPYMLICGLAIIFAVPIANAYFTLESSGIYDGGLLAFTGANFILENLPVVVLIMSVVGGIFLFINIVRSGAEQNLTS